MIRELYILLSVVVTVVLIQVFNFFLFPPMSFEQFINIKIMNVGPYNIAYVIGFVYFTIFAINWAVVHPIIWLLSRFHTNEDVNFVHTLYAQSHAKIKIYTLILFIVIIAFFTGAISWAYWAQIDELARGEGKVIPASKIQTIQSLDGGIISDILVKEGQLIKKGDPLIKIDTTRFKASLDENRDALESLIASKVRLKAEMYINIYKKLPTLVFKDKKLDGYPGIIEIQKNIFKTRFIELQTSIRILRIQNKQKKQELVELKSKKEQLYKSLMLIEEEMETIEKLVKRKALSNIDLIAIKKEHNSILGDYTSTKLSIPRSKLSIKESENKIAEKINMFKSEAAKELQKVSSEMNRYQSKVISERDKLDKTIILSPVDGIIKQINFNTIGGVVRSGVDLMEIVPNSKILLVEAKISPRDIAFINPSQKAIVKITAYDFSIYGGLDGKIVEISADSIKDKDTKDGKTYYKIVIQTDKNYLEKDGKHFSIIPGMVASVDIVTGQKTILDFILKPILKTKQSAFHER
ncbi:MAG: HlyD family type I secretion periplasmic adaptor subunit [Campylobacterota bacterium]|nr:HlyD family type I secretion periplasmic adaptor subunit [Campylobacterota bacterium]